MWFLVNDRVAIGSFDEISFLRSGEVFGYSWLLHSSFNLSSVNETGSHRVSGGIYFLKDVCLCHRSSCCLQKGCH